MDLNKKLFVLTGLVCILSVKIVQSQEKITIPITTKSREGVSLSASWEPNSFADWHFLGEDPLNEDSEDDHQIYKKEREVIHFYGKPGEKTIEIKPSGNDVISRISWPHQSLTGNVPEELTQLKELTHLDLSKNKLSGTLPDYIGNFPDLGNFYLDDNNFSGTIPEEMGSLSSLRRLKLNDNNFSGTIPEEMGSLSNLKNLYLHNNNLTGFENFSENYFSSLEVLTLKNNNLENVPEEIINLKKLSLLDLKNNKLRSLFEKLEEEDIDNNLDNLEYLDATHNLLGLDGFSFSSKIGQLSSLNSLTGYHNRAIWHPRMLSFDLRYNHLTEIPAEIGELGALTSLKLDNNRIKGFSYLDDDGNKQNGNDDGDAIPPSFGNLSAEDNIIPFTVLSLYNNDLSGKIPSELGKLENLKTLRLHNNNLDSEIPVELFDLDKLTTLNLENNNLKMKVKDNDENSAENESESLQWLFAARNKIKEISNNFITPSIRFLYLEENDLESLPEDFGNNLGQNIQELTLYKNNLTELPESIKNLDGGDGDIESLLSEKDQNLTYLDLGSNQLKNFPGNENQKKITAFNNLKYLNLSRQTEFTEANDLQGNMAGPVPKELTNLSSLETLLLNNNKLESLPLENWGNMSELIYFYAQNNNINNLPAEMGDLASLERLYLNNNQIEAGIPNEITETGSLLRAYLQYNSLSGALPATASWNSLERFFADENQITGGITQDFVTGLSSLKYFSINNSSLDGEINPAINEMRSLKWWDMAQNNQLYGMLPSSIGDISTLEMLDFNNDKITEVPDSINKLSNLHTIFGFENEVADFAEEIGSMSALERLDFHNASGENHIANFPTGVENLNNLIYFSFGENETVSGEVPWEDWLNNYPQDALFLNNNQLTGSFADGMLNETKDMVFFNARNNNFSGEIPES